MEHKDNVTRLQALLKKQSQLLDDAMEIIEEYEKREKLEQTIKVGRAIEKKKEYILKNNGKKGYELAYELGISPARVSQIRRGTK